MGLYISWSIFIHPLSSSDSFLVVRLNPNQLFQCHPNPSICVCTSENLEPHSAPLEIGHPEVGRYFSEFADTHYGANEELQARYPEDTEETLRAVQELYHRLSEGSAAQDQAPATDQSSQQALPM